LRLAIVLVLVLAVIGAGCGGDDEAAEKTNTGVVTDTVGTDETTTDETTTDESDDTDSGSFASGECQELIDAAATLGLIAASDAFEAEEVSEFSEALIDAAPEEIRSDIETVADAWATVPFEDLGLEPGEPPSAADIARYQQALAATATPEVTAANERLTAWAEENCPGG
jgi:hypothetical protein